MGGIRPSASTDRRPAGRGTIPNHGMYRPTTVRITVATAASTVHLFEKKPISQMLYFKERAVKLLLKIFCVMKTAKITLRCRTMVDSGDMPEANAKLPACTQAIARMTVVTTDCNAMLKYMYLEMMSSVDFRGGCRITSASGFSVARAIDSQASPRTLMTSSCTAVSGATHPAITAQMKSPTSAPLVDRRAWVYRRVR